MDHNGEHLEIWPQMLTSNEESEGDFLHHKIIHLSPLEDLAGEVDGVLVGPNFLHQDGTDGPIVGRQVHIQGVTHI